MLTIWRGLRIRFQVPTVGFALGLVLSPVPLLSQTFLNYEAFDPARIGLPALTETGREYLIEQHKQLIEEGRKAIEDVKQRNVSNAAEIIERYEATIREEYRQIARLTSAARIEEAVKIAAAGQTSDLPKLREMLTTVIEAARYNALTGNEEEAQRQSQGAIKVFTTFLSNFRTTCYSQSFDPGIAIGLTRQSELLGAGIDVIPCAYRNYTVVAGVISQHVMTISHCGIGIGDWKIGSVGDYQAKGVATVGMDRSGTWFIDGVMSERKHPGFRASYQQWGDLKVIPSSQGPGSLGDLWFHITRIKTTVLPGSDRHHVVGATGDGPVDFTIRYPITKKSDVPCRPTDE